MVLKIDSGGARQPEVKPLAAGVTSVAGGSAARGETDPAHDSIITLTAVDTRAGWRFASFQNTLVSDPRADR
ncbi:hypothetical protein [Micromonospora sp. 067-2]|uniref:hypothetical protein n=1 Tax=Micromonospora sp. 067-2 TaxID=2789270 RepID=UPI00397B5F8A